MVLGRECIQLKEDRCSEDVELKEEKCFQRKDRISVVFFFNKRLQGFKRGLNGKNCSFEEKL
jgi:hypothetical protein